MSARLRVTSVALLVACFLVAGTAAAAAQGYGSTPSLTASATNVTPGQTITVTGEHYPAGSVNLAFHSDPVALGTAMADSNGHFAVNVTIPASASSGGHTISATSADGSVSLSVAVTVSASGVAGEATPATPTASNGILAYTGSHVGMLLGIAGALLLLGLAFAYGSRRSAELTATDQS